MYDAALHAREAAGARGAFLAKLGVQPGKFAICTIHRAENTDDGARLACLLDYVSRDCGAEAIVWPVHPRTRAVMTRTNVEVPLSIKLTEPLGYFDLQGLLANACAVYTDSGGVQKEAYFHGVPCVTLRSETEWVETVEAGWNRLWTEPAYKPRRPIEDYGDGRAAERIVAAVSEFLALRTPSKRA
jgi:UDP-GlcNAc3NAcA epimerase